MPSRYANIRKRRERTLNLYPGEIVEVRSENEILSTLDENRMLEGLPFMPEMRKYYEKRYMVSKRLNKIVVEGTGRRRIRNTVVLEGVACDGQFNEGCGRTCLLFWKEAWLRRVTDRPSRDQSAFDSSSMSIRTESPPKRIPFCQSTSLVRATIPIRFFDLDQYVWTIRCLSLRPAEELRSFLTFLRSRVINLLRRQEPVVVSGELRQTPIANLNLQPGELVEVKSKEEILATLDRKGRNRGLGLTVEMLKYCGKRYRVLRRLDKIVVEQTGQIRQIANTVILENAACDGSANGGCPRSCYCMWREIWLERVE
jgi:hypothetical protein